MDLARATVDAMRSDTHTAVNPDLKDGTRWAAAMRCVGSLDWFLSEIEAGRLVWAQDGGVE